MTGTRPAGRYPLAPVRSGARYVMVAARSDRHAVPPVYRLDLGTVAGRAGVHPDLVRRFCALGMLDAVSDAAGRLWFTARAPADIARIQRLRAGLCLTYAAIGLVTDLLDRIDRLERALARRPQPPADARPPPRGHGPRS